MVDRKRIREIEKKLSGLMHQAIGFKDPDFGEGETIVEDGLIIATDPTNTFPITMIVVDINLKELPPETATLLREYIRLMNKPRAFYINRLKKFKMPGKTVIFAEKGKGVISEGEIK